ncbi:uncharacterized protein BJ171DRAFT_502816 [Polychytrium aggregatum]|uniref:uncharacterized protein n=1 Tax=Polychytrium aggregatum TaxID=110093 RepID=UPI0022FE81B0|nr:uncharacterized protein BJ171DRAFT_502816 [Polychytrium aggregatum]KAI9205048.1 hypothetical protein BJ171DRAFT_502816 [Polychytrium aggregatum]
MSFFSCLCFPSSSRSHGGDSPPLFPLPSPKPHSETSGHRAGSNLISTSLPAMTRSASALASSPRTSSDSKSTLQPPTPTSTTGVPPLPKMPPFWESMPWIHPMLALVSVAVREPDRLAIWSFGSGGLMARPVRITYLELWRAAFTLAENLKAVLPATEPSNDPDQRLDSAVAAGTINSSKNSSHSDSSGRRFFQQTETVGIFVDTGPDWIIAIYAIWILGKIACPLYINSPVEVLNTAVARLQINYILYNEKMPDIGMTVRLNINDFRKPIEVPPPDITFCSPVSYFLIYYQSVDSTGSTQFSILPGSSARGFRTSNWFAPHVKTCISMGPTFALSVFPLLAQSNARCSLWVARLAENMFEKAFTLFMMLDSGVEQITLTPITMRFLLSIKGRAASWSRLKYLIIGSEVVDLPLLRAIRELMPQVIIVCAYSSSVAGVVGASARCLLTPKDPIPNRLIYTNLNPTCQPKVMDMFSMELMEGSRHKRGALCFLIPKDLPIVNTPYFLSPHKYSPFGFLPDGRPRARCLDEAEMVDGLSFVIHGKLDRHIQCGDAFFDPHPVETSLRSDLAAYISDCRFIVSSNHQIFIFYTSQISNRDATDTFINGVMHDALVEIFEREGIPLEHIPTPIRVSHMPFSPSLKLDRHHIRKILDELLRQTTVPMSEYLEQVAQIPLILFSEAAPGTSRYPIGLDFLVSCQASFIGAQLYRLPLFEGRDFKLGSLVAFHQQVHGAAAAQELDRLAREHQRLVQEYAQQVVGLQIDESTVQSLGALFANVEASVSDIGALLCTRRV